MEVELNKLFISYRFTERSKKPLDFILIHAIKIQYSQKESNDYIVILFDNSTCFVRLKYYKNFKPEQIVPNIKKFHNLLYDKEHWGQGKRAIHFVTDETGLKSTVLSLTKKEALHLFENSDNPFQNIEFEPPVVFKKEDLLMAGDLKKIKNLQKRLREYQNLYNTGFKNERTLPIKIIYKEYIKKWNKSNCGASKPKVISKLAKMFKL